MTDKLNADWIADCRSNEDETTLEDWIMTVLNCREVSIDDEGSVWIDGPQTGSWLSQEDCDDLVSRIDAGV